MSLLTGWRYCPRDASELVRDDDHLHCPACEARYWANSAPGTEVLLERDGRILLGRRRDDPGAGRWDLPGGFLHEGEDVIEGLRREVREETGLELEDIEFFGTWNEPYWERHVLCLTWRARPAGGDERPGDDLVELRWFSRDDRPRGNDLAFSHYEDVLTRWEQVA